MVNSKQISESQLQAACVYWFRLQYQKLTLFAIPNGAWLQGKDKAKRARQWAKLKKEGAMSGVADLFLAQPSGDLAGLWIEMKVGGNKQTKTQKSFEGKMTAAGYGYAVVRTFEQFQNTVRQYLETGILTER